MKTTLNIRHERKKDRMNETLHCREDEKLSTMFPHIAGYRGICEEAAQIIDFCENKELYESKGSHSPHGWLFYGEPGMGKTQVVMDIADYLKLPFIEVSTSDAIEKKITIEEDIYQGFKEAEKQKKCILFIDELDKIAGYNKYCFDVVENLSNRKILLHELDKIKSQEDVIVIATCNDLSFLGETLSRSGRFDKQIRFNYPTADDRKAILNHYLTKARLEECLTVGEIVRMTDGFSCADIENVVNEAIIHSVSKRREALSADDFTYAVGRVSLRDIPKKLEGTDELKKAVAYHEAGHAYMLYRLLPDQLGTVSVGSQGKSEGYNIEAGDDKTKAYTKRDMESTCMVLIAGLLSAKMMTGECCDGSSGDIETAFKMITKMMNAGLYGFEYCFFYDTYRALTESELMLNAIYSKRCEILNDLKEKALVILEEGKSKIEALATRLMSKNCLSSKEVRGIFDSN